MLNNRTCNLALILCFFLMGGCGRKGGLSPAPSANNPNKEGSPGAPANGWEVGSGGDAYAGQFVEFAYEISDILRDSPITEVSAADFEQAIRKTKVASFDALTLNENTVDARNFADALPPRIEMSRSSWDRLQDNRLEKIKLVLHEFLGILKIDDVGYQVSRKVDSPRIFGRLLPFSTSSRERLLGSCRYFKKDSERAVETLSMPRNLTVTLTPPDGRIRTAVCFDLSPLADRLNSEALTGFDTARRLWLFGIGFNKFPERIFEGLKQTELLWLRTYGDIRPSQYQEIDNMPALTSIYFQDEGYSGPARALAFLMTAASRLKNFNCVAGTPWESSREEFNIGFGVGAVCVRKPSVPQTNPTVPRPE